MYAKAVVTNVLLGLCLVVTAFALGCSGWTGGDRGGDDSGASYSDPLLGWTVSFPERFWVVRVDERERLWFFGAAVTSFPLEGDPLVALEQAPSDGVGLLIGHGRGASGGELFGREADLPLDLSDFSLPREPRGPVAKRRLVFSANGWGVEVYVYVGRDASPRDRMDLEKIVASLRFPVLEEGSVTGSGFYVLGRAERYRVGSVTRFSKADLPQNSLAHRRSFFLVQAPGGFYAIGHTANLVGGFPDCDLQFDAARFQFFCSNGARWDRVGRVIANPDPTRFRDDPLMLFVTRVGQDGHVLVTLNAYTHATDTLARRLWHTS